MAHGARRLATKALLLVTLVALMLSVVAGIPNATPRANAIIGGDSGQGPYNVRITYQMNGKPETCSGALIAERWILTAAHCMRQKYGDDRDPEYGRRLPPSAYQLFLGQFQPSNANPYSFDFALVGSTYKNILPNAQTAYSDDYALLHLTRAAPPNLVPLPIIRSRAQLPENRTVSMEGWGQTDFKVAPGQSYRGTFGGWTRSPRCSIPTSECFSKNSPTSPTPFAGDSGGPVTTFAGPPATFTQIAIYSGPGPASRVQYGASILTYLPLILFLTQLPSPAPNTIVRDGSTGQSWLTDGKSLGHYIPDGGTYNCLVAKGARVQTMSHYNAYSVPRDFGNATCS